MKKKKVFGILAAVVLFIYLFLMYSFNTLLILYFYVVLYFHFVDPNKYYLYIYRCCRTVTILIL